MIFNIPSWNMSNIFSLYITYVSLRTLFLQFIYQFLFLFCLFKLVFSLTLIRFYLIYYQDNNIELHKEHHFSSVEKRGNNFFWRKKRKQNKKQCYSLQLKDRAHFLLLADLLIFVVETMVRSLVHVNSKNACEEINQVLLKHQSIKSSTTKLRCILHHYLHSFC